MISPHLSSKRLLTGVAVLGLLATGLGVVLAGKPPQEQRFPGPLKMDPPHITTDKSVEYDFDIVYVRAPRKSADGRSRWAEVGDPRTMEPGADLMLLRPDGTEKILVGVKGSESIADPAVSFDGAWVYYAKFHDAKDHKGSDLYKVHVPTGKVVRLTRQQFTPNTGAADWSKTPLPSWGVFNLGPCPVPGGRLAFVSDRNAFKATNPGYAPNALALQLFVMDEDGGNVECIGHLNLGMALHPVILKDGRIMFSSLESEGCAAITCGGCGRSTPTAPAGGRYSAPSRSATPRRTRPTSRRNYPTNPSSPSRTTTSTTSASAPTTSSRPASRRTPRRSGRRTRPTRATPACATAGTPTGAASTSSTPSAPSGWRR